MDPDAISWDAEENPSTSRSMDDKVKKKKKKKSKDSKEETKQSKEEADQEFLMK